MNRNFICFGSDEGTVLLNVSQITRAVIVAEDELIIHMSDKSSWRCCRKDTVGKVAGLFAADTVNLEGELMIDVWDQARAHKDKIEPAKPEDEP